MGCTSSQPPLEELSTSTTSTSQTGDFIRPAKACQRRRGLASGRPRDVTHGKALATRWVRNTGNTGWWIDGIGGTFGGNSSAAMTYTVAMTAPATAGVYPYTVWTVKGYSGLANSTAYNITVGTTTHHQAVAGVVKFGKVVAKVSSWTATKIIVKVPAGHYDRKVLVTVTPKGAKASNGVEFSVKSHHPPDAADRVRPSRRHSKGSGMWKLVVFAVSSALIAAASWRSLWRPAAHGLPRFLAWEVIGALILFNVEHWFTDPWSPLQLLSWVLLVGSLLLVGSGLHLLRTIGPAMRVPNRRTTRGRTRANSSRSVSTATSGIPCTPRSSC
jgi:hypothetical protein